MRKERLKREIDQTTLAKELNVTSVMLSNWELNRKPTPPKYLNRIIKFLGYTPRIKLGFDRLGTYTQLFRKNTNISLEEFSQQIKISQKEIKHLEEGKFGKRHRVLKKQIKEFLKLNLTSSVRHP